MCGCVGTDHTLLSAEDVGEDRGAGSYVLGARRANPDVAVVVSALLASDLTSDKIVCSLPNVTILSVDRART